MRRFRYIIPSSFNIINPPPLLRNYSTSQATKISSRLQNALRKRKQLCGLPNLYTSVFRAVDGVNDGLPKECVVDAMVLRRNGGDKEDKEEELSLFHLHQQNTATNNSTQSTEEQEELEKLVASVFQKDGYEDMKSKKNSEKLMLMSNNTASSSSSLFTCRDIGVEYPMSHPLLNQDFSSTLLAGRSVRQSFLFDVLEKSAGSEVNVGCFNLIEQQNHHPSQQQSLFVPTMLGHIASSFENTKKCVVFERNSELIKETETICDLNKEEQRTSKMIVSKKTVHEFVFDQQQRSENDVDDNNSSHIIEVASVELSIPSSKREKKDLSNEKLLQRTTIKKAIEMVYRGAIKKNRSNHQGKQLQQPGRVFVMIYGGAKDNKSDDDAENTKNETTTKKDDLVFSAEAYGADLLRTCSVFQHLKLDFPIGEEAKKFSEEELIQKAVDIMNTPPEKNENRSEFHPTIRIVKKVGQGPEFPIRIGAGSKKNFVGEAYATVCGFLVEVW